MTSLKVAVRVRPLSERESLLGSKVVVDVQGKDILVTDVKVPEKHGCDHRVRVHRFTFDYGFWSLEPSSKKCASQRTVYEEFGRIVLNTLLEGYNCCVIAYGPSGSGKTYTVMGTKEESGLTPRICEGLFTTLTDKTDHHLPFHVDISFMELYNEQVFDLLQKTDVQNKRKPKLRVREHPSQGPFVEGLSTHSVKNIDEVCDLLARGNAERTNAATHVHDSSSRSHAIFTIRCSQACLDHTKPKEVVSKLHLVDLAGSEKAAPEFCQTRVKEGGNINKSLVTLGNVIASLVELSQRAKNGMSTRKHTYVPYRDSHLTWLLKDSLGGNSHTFMLAAISPSKDCYIDTVSTLRYAQRAKLVMNRPIVNEDPSTEMIRNLRNEVVRLRTLLCTAEKLSKAYIMKPLPEITQLKSIMKESARKVDMLTKHWFEKWLQTYDVVINKTGKSEAHDQDTSLSTSLKKDLSVVKSIDGTMVDRKLEDSSECVIMKNEVVSFYKNKVFSENNYFTSENHYAGSDSESKNLNEQMNENIQFLKKDFADGTKYAFRKNFESVSENPLQVSQSTNNPRVLRSLSLSQTHMRKPYDIYTWLVQKPVESDAETESSPRCQILSGCEEKTHREINDYATFGTVWGTYQQKIDRASDDRSTKSTAEDHVMDQAPDKEVTSEKTGIICDESTEQVEKADKMTCEAHLNVDLKTNSQIHELKVDHDSAATIRHANERIIFEAKVPNLHSCEIPFFALGSINAGNEESFGTHSEIDVVKCIEPDGHNRTEVTFSEQVREESNNLVELLKSMEPESIESVSEYCCSKRKDSEIMSLLSFSSLDGQYFRSMDDFTSNEDSGSVCANEQHRGSVYGESMSSCNSDVNSIKPFHLQASEDGEIHSKRPLFIRGLGSKEINLSQVSTALQNIIYKVPPPSAAISDGTNPCAQIGETTNIAEGSHQQGSSTMKPYSEQHVMNRSETPILSKTNNPSQSPSITVGISQITESVNISNSGNDIQERTSFEKDGSPPIIPRIDKDSISELNDEVHATSFELTKANLDLLAEKLRNTPERTQNYSITRTAYSGPSTSQISPWVPQKETPPGIEMKACEHNDIKSEETSNTPENYNEPTENNIESTEVCASGVFGTQFQFNFENPFRKFNISEQMQSKSTNKGDINHGDFSERFNVFKIGYPLPSDPVKGLKDCEVSWECNKSAGGSTFAKSGADYEVLAVPEKMTIFPTNESSSQPSRPRPFRITRADDPVDSSNGFGTSNIFNKPHLLPSEDDSKLKESEKDAESDFETFTLDSLDNFDNEMKAWAQKYLTKCDSRQSSELEYDKVIKPEIISGGTEISELGEFELTAGPGKALDAAAEDLKTEISFPSYQNQKDLSSCSSSSSSSDSITYVFVGKGENDVKEATINKVNSVSQYSSLQSSVSLDSLEKSGLQPKYLACLSPRTLSIDSLVAEELFYQLKNSDLGQASRSDPVEQMNSNETSRPKQNFNRFFYLQSKPFHFANFAGNATEPEPIAAQPCSRKFNLELETLEGGSNAYDTGLRSPGQDRTETKNICDRQPVLIEQRSPNTIDAISSAEHQFDIKQTEGLTISNDEENNNLDNVSAKDNENTIGSLNLLIPPPSSFDTEHVDADIIFEQPKDIDMMSKSTQTQESSFEASDSHKPCDTSVQTDVIQLAFRMMELVTEIFKCLKELKNNQSNHAPCCGIRNSPCQHCHFQKKNIPIESSDSWTCSSNASSEVEKYSPQENPAAAHRLRKATVVKNNQCQLKSSTTTSSCSEEASDYKCNKKLKKRRRCANQRREACNDYYYLDDCVRNQLLQLPSFAKELASLRENEQCAAANSNHLNRDPPHSQVSGTTNRDSASVSHNDTYLPPSTKETGLLQTAAENQLKHLIEIHQRLAQETNKGTSLVEDKNGNSSTLQMNKKETQSNSSSEGYLSSISSRGDSSHSEPHRECQSPRPYPVDVASLNKSSKSSKTKPLLLNVGAENHATQPSTSWQNTSADSGAFFMDSPLVEKKDFVDMNLNPYILKENISYVKRLPESSAVDDFGKCERGASKIPDNLLLSRRDSERHTPSLEASAVKSRNSLERGKELQRNDEKKTPSSIIINRVPPKTRGFERELSSDVQDNSTDARFEFAKKLSDDNYKITRGDIERILLSIEADKKFLRRKRNPILDRCYSPEITLCSPSLSDESIFSCDSFKKLPHPVLYVRTEASGLHS